MSRPTIAATLWLSGVLWSLWDTGTNPAALLGVAAVAVTGLAVLTITRALTVRRPGGGTGPVTARATALRRRAHGMRLPRLRDPDAAGRPRPRAPSAALAAG